MFDAIKPYLALIKLALLAGALFGAYAAGSRHAEAAAAAAELAHRNAAISEALQAERQASARSASLARADQRRQDARQMHAITITQEVTRYVENENARRAAGGAVVQLDADWVRQHNAAASVPGDIDAGSVPAAAAEPVTAGAALETVAANYEQCYAWRDQVIGWQAWWAAQPPGVSSTAAVH
ncbi:hypothetical protein BUE93_04025 [Chromobacterium amazonense]|uniref:Uncharacterized protein n=1 Tax=Chromobacterium amazonense TaxID=1382803 RepID=A0A2S9X7W0_9NEIS|nr:hypothetical protein [Chromobacterium amazonense]PRP71820.1 hypothetical protein BUE93_04025 [Chromobacterium amazonense]